MKDITPENLIEMLPQLGAWSQYHLATIALEYYFPKEYSEDENPSTDREVEMLGELGFQYWSDVTEKYHKEIGYTTEQLSKKDYVNER